MHWRNGSKPGMYTEVSKVHRESIWPMVERESWCVLLWNNSIHFHFVGSATATINQVEFTPCPSEPCQVKKGDNATIKVDLTSSEWGSFYYPTKSFWQKWNMNIMTNNFRFFKTFFIRGGFGEILIRAPRNHRRSTCTISASKWNHVRSNIYKQ
jgi:hypothetical protein